MAPKAQPPRVQRPRRATPADALRPTRAEVNLGHLRHNLRVLRRFAGTSRLWGVLKADAYGHGAPAVARTLERAGVDGICVALLEEAVELRNAGIRAQILVMGGNYGHGWGELLESNLTPVIYSPDQLHALANEVRANGYSPVSVHLKIDTGMARLGVRPNTIEPMLDQIRNSPEVKLTGMMTHFANADGDDLESTENQRILFDQAVAKTRSAGFQLDVIHAANSAALIRVPLARYDLVRPGIALFGVSPRPGLISDLRPVMRVRSEIVALREVQSGDCAGYGSTWIAQRTSTVATVPIGYADGFPRILSNRGRMLVRGRSAPIVGAVSMDMTMIDVTDLEGASLRDEVVVLGTQQGPLGTDCIEADEIAAMAGTISWEVLTGISRRVPRFFREP
ncbi:MAG: alanine racemase [Polyangiaceae bacterium]|nr:alanine racemase [Polyangiaceae bacterium]